LPVARFPEIWYNRIMRFVAFRGSTQRASTPVILSGHLFREAVPDPEII